MLSILNALNTLEPNDDDVVLDPTKPPFKCLEVVPAETRTT